MNASSDEKFRQTGNDIPRWQERQKAEARERFGAPQCTMGVPPMIAVFRDFSRYSG
jgi:hypothetical protein